MSCEHLQSTCLTHGDHEDWPLFQRSETRCSQKGHHPAAKASSYWKLQMNKEIEENKEWSAGPRTLWECVLGGRPFPKASPCHRVPASVPVSGSHHETAQPHPHRKQTPKKKHTHNQYRWARAESNTTSVPSNSRNTSDCVLKCSRLPWIWYLKKKKKGSSTWCYWKRCFWRVRNKRKRATGMNYVWEWMMQRT